VWYDNFVVNASASMRMGWKHPFYFAFGCLIALKHLSAGAFKPF